MANKPMWMVRAGHGARAAAEFREHGVVGIGWGGTDWTKFESRDVIVQQLHGQYPEFSAR